VGGRHSREPTRKKNTPGDVIVRKRKKNNKNEGGGKKEEIRERLPEVNFFWGVGKKGAVGKQQG